MKNGIMQTPRQRLEFDSRPRTPLSERSTSDFDTNESLNNKENVVVGNMFMKTMIMMTKKEPTMHRQQQEEKKIKETNDDDNDDMKDLVNRMTQELANAKAELAILKEKKQQKNGLKSPIMMPSPPPMETPMRFKRERDSFKKELEMISQNAEKTEELMLTSVNEEAKRARENEAWLLKALNEKTRALKIAARANNQSEKELEHAQEALNASEANLKQTVEKVSVLKTRLQKNEAARKKLEMKVHRYRDALKDACNKVADDNVNNEVQIAESVITAASNESYCGENNIITPRIEIDEDEGDDVHFRVSQHHSIGGFVPPQTPAMFNFQGMNRMQNYDDELDLLSSDTTSEVNQFYTGRKNATNISDVQILVLVLSVIVMTSLWMMIRATGGGQAKVMIAQNMSMSGWIGFPIFHDVADFFYSLFS